MDIVCSVSIVSNGQNRYMNLKTKKKHESNYSDSSFGWTISMLLGKVVKCRARVQSMAEWKMIAIYQLWTVLVSIISWQFFLLLLKENRVNVMQILRILLGKTMLSMWKKRGKISKVIISKNPNIHLEMCCCLFFFFSFGIEFLNRTWESEFFSLAQSQLFGIYYHHKYI